MSANVVPLTVAVPVGPLPHNRRWLAECLASVDTQDPLPADRLLIDDGGEEPLVVPDGWRSVRIPWPSGIAHAHNYCVGAATYDLCIILNSDDQLLPGAIRAAWSAWERERDALGYYWFDVQYSDGEVQTVCDGCSMATRGLWRLTGGLPLEGAVGSSDWMFVSLMHTRGLSRHLHRIASTPYYWYRQHGETDTNRNLRTGRLEISKTILDMLTREARGGA